MQWPWGQLPGSQSRLHQPLPDSATLARDLTPWGLGFLTQAAVVPAVPLSWRGALRARAHWCSHQLHPPSDGGWDMTPGSGLFPRATWHYLAPGASQISRAPSQPWQIGPQRIGPPSQLVPLAEQRLMSRCPAPPPPTLSASLSIPLLPLIGPWDSSSFAFSRWVHPACSSHPQHTPPRSSQEGREEGVRVGAPGWACCTQSPAWPYHRASTMQRPLPLPLESQDPSLPWVPANPGSCPLPCQACGHQPGPWPPLRQKLRQCQSEMTCGPRSNYQGDVSQAVLGTGQGPCTAISCLSVQ